MNERERFYEKVPDRPPAECWPWAAGRTNGGYGSFSYEGRPVGAHRASYLIHTGPIHPGMVVRHKCDRPSCVNPEHLELGTPGENTQDIIRAGRFDPSSRVGERHPLARLTWSDVREIRRRHQEGEPVPSIAADYPVSRRTIADIVIGKTWRV